MKQSILLCLLLLISSSCQYVAEGRYGFCFKNNSDDDLCVIMDLNPTENGISNNCSDFFVRKKNITSVSRSINDDWGIKDSVYFYLVYLDSLNRDGSFSYTLSDVKEDYLICRMTLLKEQIIDSSHQSPMKTIYYPPLPESGVPIIYYK